MRTTRVERRTLARTIRTVGRVTYEEKLISCLHPKIEGWITKLYVYETGEQVKRNQELLQIYSPQLMSTEEEYVLALDGLEGIREQPLQGRPARCRKSGEAGCDHPLHPSIIHMHMQVDGDRCRFICS